MTVRLEPTRGYHGVRSQLSRFSNSAGKPPQDGTQTSCASPRAAPLKSSRISLNVARIDDLGVVRKSWRMVRAFLLAALSFVVSAYPVLAQETNVSVGMLGIGGMSCAYWRATKEHVSEGTVWIYGFWTGLNYVAAASEQAQSGTDTPEIVAEVKKRCAQAPSQTLASIVWNTYLAFNKR